MNIFLSLIFAFSLSSLSSIFFKSMGFPLKALEIVFFLIYIYYNRNIQRIYFNKKFLMHAAYLACILLFISLLCHNSEPLINFVSSIRYYYFFIFGFCLFRYNSFFNIKQLFYISLFCTVFDLFASLYNFISIKQIVTTGDDVVFVNNINFLVQTLFISISFFLYKNKLITLLLLLSLSLSSSFLSITRGLFMFIVLCIIVNVLIYSVIRLKSFIKYFISIFIVSFLCLFIYQTQEERIREISPSTHYRLYTKYEEGDETGDDIRVNQVIYLVTHLDESFVPHGFPIWETLRRFRESNFMLFSVRDSSLVAIVYTFGIFSIFLFISFIRNYLKLLKNILQRNDKWGIILLPTLTLIPLFFFFGYGLIADVSKIFSLGMILGIVYRNNQIFNSEKSLTFV